MVLALSLLRILRFVLEVPCNVDLHSCTAIRSSSAIFRGSAAIFRAKNLRKIRQLTRRFEFEPSSIFIAVSLAGLARVWTGVQRTKLAQKDCLGCFKLRNSYMYMCTYMYYVDLDLGTYVAIISSTVECDY